MRKLLAAALRTIYTAPTADLAATRSTTFEARPVGAALSRRSSRAWRRAWATSFRSLRFRPTPTAALHDERPGKCASRLRKIIKTRGHFPNDEAATKLLWLALRNESLQDPLR